LDGWQVPDWSLERSGLSLLLDPDSIAQIDFGNGPGAHRAQPLAGQIAAAGNAGANSASQRPDLTASGAEALTRFEGDSTRLDNIRGLNPRTRIYPDTGNRPTFGIGHLMTKHDNRTWAPNLPNMTLSQQQQTAQDLFQKDVARHRASARDYVGADAFDALAPHQQDALVIAEFNGGRRGALGPKMRQHIRDGALDRVANDFDAWHETVNGARVMNRGLVNRQLETGKIWDGRYDYTADPDLVKKIMDRGGY
jgi:GH24 family phage-related lysozyme (muramidase)